MWKLFGMCVSLTALGSQIQFEQPRKAVEGEQFMREHEGKGECWSSSFLLVDRSCKGMGVEDKQKLALSFTRCHLSGLGRANYLPRGCVDDNVPLSDCTRDMSGDLFSLYTQFYVHTDNLCFYIQSAAWQTQAEKTISELTDSSKMAASRVSALLVKQEQSLVNEAQILIHENRILETVIRSKEQLGATTNLLQQSITRLGSELDSQSRKLELANGALERVVGGQTRMLVALRDSSLGSWAWYSGAFLSIVVLSQLLHNVVTFSISVFLNRHIAELWSERLAEIKYDLRKRCFVLLVVCFAAEEALCYLLPVLPSLLLYTLSAFFYIVSFLARVASFVCASLGYNEVLFANGTAVEQVWSTVATDCAPLVQLAIRNWAASWRYTLLPLLVTVCVAQSAWYHLTWPTCRELSCTNPARKSKIVTIGSRAGPTTAYTSSSSTQGIDKSRSSPQGSTAPPTGAIGQAEQVMAIQHSNGTRGGTAQQKRCASNHELPGGSVVTECSPRRDGLHTESNDGLLLGSMQTHLDLYAEQLHRTLHEWKQAQLQQAPDGRVPPARNKKPQITSLTSASETKPQQPAASTSSTHSNPRKRKRPAGPAVAKVKATLKPKATETTTKGRRSRRRR
jgi:hypothetical protein